jgi:hypothetical protein
MARRSRKPQLRGSSANRPSRPEVDLGASFGGGFAVRLQPLAEFACLLALILAVVRTAVAHWFILLYPYEANFGEGGVLYDALRLARGQPIYAPAETGQWISPYPPLFAWIVSWWPTPTFFFPRLISQLAFLGSGVAVTGILRKMGLSWRAAAMAALFWYSNPYIRTFAAMGRVDTLGRFWESLALLVGLTLAGSHGNRLASGALFALGMATKQTMIAGPLTLFGYWWRESRRHALELVGTWLVFTIICYIIISIACGASFIPNVFFDIKRSLEWQSWWPWLLGFVLCNVPLLVLALWGLAKVPPEPITRFSCWAIVAGLPAVVLAAQDGADVNYFFDVTWGLCAAAALGYEHLCKKKCMTNLAGLMLVAGGILFTDWSIPARYPTAEQARQAAEVHRILAAAPKPVISEFIGFGLLVGSDPPAIPYLDKKLEEGNRRSSAPLVKRLRNKEFGAVLVTSQAGGRWSPAVLQALEQSYDQQYVFPRMFASEGEPDFAIFVPKAP